MTINKTFTEAERAALRAHGLNDVHQPSQLSDAFVLGMRYALNLGTVPDSGQQKDQPAVLAFAIADEAMYELLVTECVRITDGDLGLCGVFSSEVPNIGEASEAIRDALNWLEPRGYVELLSDSTGDFIRVLKVPAQVRSIPQAGPNEKVVPAVPSSSPGLVDDQPKGGQ